MPIIQIRSLQYSALTYKLHFSLQKIGSDSPSGLNTVRFWIELRRNPGL